MGNTPAPGFGSRKTEQSWWARTLRQLSRKMKVAAFGDSSLRLAANQVPPRAGWQAQWKGAGANTETRGTDGSIGQVLPACVCKSLREARQWAPSGPVSCNRCQLCPLGWQWGSVFISMETGCIQSRCKVYDTVTAVPSSATPEDTLWSKCACTGVRVFGGDVWVCTHGSKTKVV